jgi:hypothetical protein
MKARLLTKLLNNTGYRVNNNKDYIAVGSPLCHDLISVNKETLKVKYALDTFREGRKYLEGQSNSKGENELLFIWDKLHELIENGQIHDIINGNDEIENPLPIWTFEDGQLIETYTDTYDFPNVTIDGYTMYTNTHFKTKEEAIEKAISEYKYGVEMMKERVIEQQEKLKEINERLNMYEGYVEHFKSLK